MLIEALFNTDKKSLGKIIKKYSKKNTSYEGEFNGMEHVIAAEVEKRMKEKLREIHFELEDELRKHYTISKPNKHGEMKKKKKYSSVFDIPKKKNNMNVILNKKENT